MSKRKDREERRREALKKKQRQEKKHSTKSFQEQQEVDSLNDIIATGAPAPGVNPLSVDQAAAGSYAGARTFEELPLSRYTTEALKQAGYVTLTAIQRAALPHALAGRDVLGAAKTGSGKTLCFLIPVSWRWRRPGHAHNPSRALRNGVIASSSTLELFIKAGSS